MPNIIPQPTAQTPYTDCTEVVGAWEQPLDHGTARASRGLIHGFRQKTSKNRKNLLSNGPLSPNDGGKCTEFVQG